MHTSFVGEGGIHAEEVRRTDQGQGGPVVTEHRGDYANQWEAITTVAGRRGMRPETLRRWVRQAAVDTDEAEGCPRGRGCQIAPGTYYAWARRAPSRRALWELAVTEVLAGYYEPGEHGRRPLESLYGSLKMWAYLQRWASRSRAARSSG
jgi:transposase-like protein